MATHMKPGSLETTNGYSQDERLETTNGGGFFVMEFVLRVFAVGATLAAAIAMGTAKQTKTVPVLVNSVPVLATVPAKYHYSPAFVYFVVANAVACGYTVLSILVSLSKRKKSSVLSTLVLTITDLVMVVLVSSAASAAAAYAYIGWKGNSHTGWNKVCNVYDKFCRHMAGALGVSFAGMIIFLILTIMQLYSLYKHTRVRR